MEKVDLKKKTCLVLDNGIFVEFAISLSKYFGKVYYWTPWISGFPSKKSVMCGVGLDGIERINDWEHMEDDIDVFVFPDVYFGATQERLRKKGKFVFGSGMGEELELLRWEMKEFLKELDLPVQPVKKIIGLEKLRDHLRSVKNKWIKISTYRRDAETWHHENYRLSEPILDKWEKDLGPMKHDYEFIVEDAIDGDDIVECYDKETEVLTDTGWKLFENVTFSDKIATQNSITKEFEYQFPTEIIKRRSDHIVKIKTKSLDLAITENHNMALIHAHNYNVGNNKIELIPLSKASKSVYSIEGSSVWNGKNVDFHTIPSLRDDRFSSGHGFRNEINILMDDWLCFLGWFLSDGCVVKYKHTTLITQSFNNPENRLLIHECLDRLPFNYNLNGNSFRINNKQLYYHLNGIGSLKKDRRVPDYIKNLSVRQIKLFLDSYWMGDGSLSSNGVTKQYHIGVSKDFAGDIQELLIKTGSIASLIRTEPTGWHKYAGRMINNSQATYNVSEYKKKFLNFTKSYCKREEYNDFVYCVSVPNHIIMVRRNGKSIWCGNCGSDVPTIDGQYPEHVIQGYEQKDLGYIAKVVKYSEMSPIITEYNRKIAPYLREVKYRMFMSTEIRVGKDKKAYMTDPCQRLGSPPNELYQNMLSNLGDIVWFGSQGIMIEPEYTAQFGLEVLIHSDWASENWQAIYFPEEIREHVKLRNACKLNGTYYIIPQEDAIPEIGAVVATGNSIEECQKKMEGYCKQIEGYRIDLKVGAIEEMMKTAKKGEKLGIKFF